MSEDASEIVEKPNAIAYDVQNNTKLQPLPPALLGRMLHTTNTFKYDFMRNPDSRPLTASSRGSTRSLISRGSSRLMSREDSRMSSRLSSRNGTPRETPRDAKTPKKPSETPKTQNTRQDSSDSGSEAVTSGASTSRSHDSHGMIPIEPTNQPDVLDLMDSQIPVQEPEIQDCVQKTNVHGGACEYSVVFGNEAPSGNRPPSRLLERLNQKSAPGAPKKKKPEDEALTEGEIKPRPKTRREQTQEGGEDSRPRTAARPTTSRPKTARSENPGQVQVIGIGVGIEDQPKRELPPPEALSEEVREQYDWLVKLLGLPIAKCLLSKFWEHRIDAIKKTHVVLQRYGNAKVEFKRRVFDVVAGVVHKGLMDNVFQVFTQSVDLCRDVLTFSEGLPKEQVDDRLGQIFEVLLRRAGDANQRVCSTTDTLLDWIMGQPHLDALKVLSKYITQPIPEPNKAYKHVIARMKLIVRLVDQYGFMAQKQDGLSPESVNMFVLDVLESANRRVCQEASEVVKLLYTKLGLRAIHLLNVQVKDNASEDYLQRALGPLIYSLMEKASSGERSSKLQASDALLALAMHEKVGPTFISKYITQPPDDLHNWQALTARLEVMSRLVSAIGFSPSPPGLSAEKVMIFALTGVQSQFEAVHKCATDLVLASHTKAGDTIWEYIVHLDADCVAELRKKVIQKAKNNLRGGCSMKARLNAEVGMARAQTKTGAFGQ